MYSPEDTGSTGLLFAPVVGRVGQVSIPFSNSAAASANWAALRVSAAPVSVQYPFR